MSIVVKDTDTQVKTYTTICVYAGSHLKVQVVHG